MPVSSVKIIAFSLLLAFAVAAPASLSHKRAPPAKPVSTSRYGKIAFQSSNDGGVTRATFNNPPINLVDAFLISDLFDFLHSLQPAPNKTSPKVVIFDSANPDWFLGHYDLHNIQLPFTQSKSNVFNQAIDCTRYILNTSSTVFIAEINGRTIGLGQELSVHMDMRFAGPNALASSFEDSIGLVAAAGGQPFLGPMVGKARAMEYLLGAKAFDGPTGEKLGLFNTYYNTGKELKSEVSALADRIALFPQHSINDTKVTPSLLNPTIASLDDQLARFVPLMNLPEDQETISKFIKASRNQTNSLFELHLPESWIQAVKDGAYV